MTHADESSIDARVRAVQADFDRRQTRLFVRFALVEGAVLAALVAAVYGFELVDPEVGVWIIVAVAVLGGGALSALLVRLIRGRAEAVARAQGQNPLF